MDLISGIAERAGASFAERLFNKKERKPNIFTKLIAIVKFLLDDPEKMELTACVEEGKLVIKVKPDKKEDVGILLKVSTFEKES